MEIVSEISKNSWRVFPEAQSNEKQKNLPKVRKLGRLGHTPPPVNKGWTLKEAVYDAEAGGLGLDASCDCMVEARRMV